MIAKSQKEFFLVRDDDTGDTKLFHHWWSAINFITDEVMKYGYRIIRDGDGDGTWGSEWREPKDRKECFNTLYNAKTLSELNEIVIDLCHIELIEFSD